MPFYLIKAKSKEMLRILIYLVEIVYNENLILSTYSICSILNIQLRGCFVKSRARFDSIT